MEGGHWVCLLATSRVSAATQWRGGQRLPLAQAHLEVAVGIPSLPEGDPEAGLSAASPTLRGRSLRRHARRLARLEALLVK